MIFMGQEWAASTPFLYFTDHPEELGRLVTKGRRREFRHFRAFSDAEACERIPDPQAECTFTTSHLQWEETTEDRHFAMFRLYQALLAIRRTEPAIRYAEIGSFQAYALSETTLLLRQDADLGPSLLAVIQAQGAADIDLHGHAALKGLLATQCQLILTTEDPPFALDPQPPYVQVTRAAPRIAFRRPSAVLLRAWPEADPALLQAQNGTSESDLPGRDE
jgi:maltooligosyltrehalose trehalohydrolase